MNSQRRSRRNRAFQGALAVVATIGLLATAACSGDPAAEAPPSGGPATTEGSADASTAPVTGGTLTLATMEINSLDPQGASAGSTGTGTVAKALFSTLVVLEDGEFVPSLATEWTPGDAETPWHFALNPEAVFSDGTPVTAADVKASLERLVELKGPYASLFGGLESVEAVDDYTLEILTPRNGTLLYALTLLYVGPADRIADEAFWQAPVGSGPYALESFVPGDSVVLNAVEGYWGDPATLDSIEFVYIPEVSGQITALEIGDVDIVINLPQDQISAVEGMSDAAVVTSQPSTINSIWLNNSHPPLDDVRVRQALWHAVDWDSIREDLYGPTAFPASAPIASGVFGWTEHEPYAFDQELATSLLSDAGFGSGLELTLKYNPAGGFSQAQSLVEAAASYWAQVGVTVKVEPQEQAVYSEDLLALEWDITPLANTSRTGDADQILGRLYVGSANRLGFSDPEVDQALADAAATADPDARLAAYGKVNDILWDNAVSIWPMEFAAVYGVSDRVQGFVPDPSSVPSFRGVTVGE